MDASFADGLAFFLRKNHRNMLVFSDIRVLGQRGVWMFANGCLLEQDVKGAQAGVHELKSTSSYPQGPSQPMRKYANPAIVLLKEFVDLSCASQA